MKTFTVSPDELVFCICEGGAEEVIINRLLDEDMLLFSRAQLHEEEVISRCKVQDFQTKFLRKAFDQRTLLVRVIDSKRERFVLKEAYQKKINRMETFRTRPEIEMLIIEHEGMYEDWCRHRQDEESPSQYCMRRLGYKQVKSPDLFLKEYYQDVNVILDALKRYHGHKADKNEFSIYDLLKEEYRH